jgi:hypothetical protein
MCGTYELKYNNNQDFLIEGNHWGYAYNWTSRQGVFFYTCLFKFAPTRTQTQDQSCYQGHC